MQRADVVGRHVEGDVDGSGFAVDPVAAFHDSFQLGIRIWFAGGGFERDALDAGRSSGAQQDVAIFLRSAILRRNVAVSFQSLPGVSCSGRVGPVKGSKPQ